jgi:NitT/TauT family transport system substrate-binding protein
MPADGGEKMQSKFLCTTVLFVALMRGIAACAPAATPTTVPATATPVPILYKIKLPLVPDPALNLPIMVAIANGYLAEEGIEITDLVYGSGGTLRQAMIAKEFDLGLFAFVHVPIARLGGSPWKMIASSHDLETFSLIVRSELKDQVKTVADLKGKTVGFTTPGAGAWALGSVFLRGAGLDPEKDVQYVSLGGDLGVIYTSLKTGKVDAFTASEPNISRFIAEGIGYPLVRIWEPAEHKKWIGSDKALALGVATREDVIKDKPDMLQRFVNAQKKGLNFIRTKTSSEIADLVLKNARTAEQFQGLDKNLLVKVFDSLKPGYGEGCLSKAGFDTEIKLAVENKLINKAITFEEFADPTFAGVCEK